MSSKSTTTLTTAQAALSGIGKLIRLLPTGTVFVYQFLNPLLTNNGHCLPIHKLLSSVLIVACGFSCCFSSFTDSYTDAQGDTHYGVATRTGLWPRSSSGQDLSAYKLRVGDFVHAFFSLMVFAVVSLLDANSVGCFYPKFGEMQKVLLMVLPPAIGTISGTVFVTYPNTRHGIGYPASQSSDTAVNSFYVPIK